MLVDKIFRDAFPEEFGNDTNKAHKANVSRDDLLSLSSEYACYARLVKHYHRECSNNLSPLAGSMKAQQRLDEYSLQYFYLLAVQCKKTYDDPSIIEDTLDKLAATCEELPGK